MKSYFGAGCSSGGWKPAKHFSSLVSALLIWDSTWINIQKSQTQYSYENGECGAELVLWCNAHSSLSINCSCWDLSAALSLSTPSSELAWVCSLLTRQLLCSLWVSVAMSRLDMPSSVVMEESCWVRDSIPLASTTITLRGRMSGEREREREREREYGRKELRVKHYHEWIK